MKVAMWGVGLIALGAFGLMLVNLFGNITVTNQLNYTSMKNAVEAAMYDAVDTAHFRSGFYLCTNNSINSETGKYSFMSVNDYCIDDVLGENCKKDEWKNCDFLEGEYKIRKNVFSESLVRRFSEVINNNKDYKITIQDVIEYPPKVSVKVDSNDEHAFNDGEFIISNQIDAILEER